MTDTLGIVEMASDARCSVAWMRRQCQRGEVPARKVGSGWVTTRRAFELWLAGVDVGEVHARLAAESAASTAGGTS